MHGVYRCNLITFSVKFDLFKISFTEHLRLDQKYSISDHQINLTSEEEKKNLDGSSVWHIAYTFDSLQFRKSTS